MRTTIATKATLLGLCGFAALISSLPGCQTGSNQLAALPLAQISAVQLFDQPNYTVAFSVQEALSNPSLVSTINWVFGDGTGFVAGPAGRTTITHKYAATGVYQVTAYVFQGTDLAATINDSATVVANGSSPSTDPTTGPLPGMIAGPNPRDKATDVAVTAKLTWTSGDKATSHDVYLGKVQSEVENAAVASAVYMGTLTVASFDPGGLTAETKYFWRIDERNDAGVTKGNTLSFTTAKAPTKAKDFVPVNGVTSAPVNQILQWTAGKNATSHDVYFGKDQAAVTNATKDTTDIFKGNQSATTYDPEDAAAPLDGELLAATTYYWRIDEVGLGGTAKGDVLEFKTADPPAAVTDPVPADGAVDVDVDTNLSWAAVPAITGFDVYLGTDIVAVANATHSNPEFKSNVTAKSYDPGTLLGGTIYYWRIDTLGAGGTSQGVVFSFTTAAPPPQVAGPFTPVDNATNVSYTVDLQWAVGVGGVTTSFDVYFSTSQIAVSGGQSSAFKGNLDVSNFVYDPNDLSPDTQYYWRIDAVGPGGKTQGLVLTFRVGALPGQVLNSPAPANGAKARPLDQQLGWQAGAGAVEHDVYFGIDQAEVQSATVQDAEYKGRQAGTTFDPGTLEGNTTYYWRIDEVSPGGATKGPVWNFTTVPGQAINPDPMDQDTGIALDVQLSWTAGAGAVSHDVYFGTVEADVLNATHATVAIFKGNQTATTWTPPDLLDGATAYYWRIDEVGSPVNGTTKGLVWKFTTGAGQAAVPIAPPNGATGVTTSPTLTWQAGAGAASHDIYFGTSQTAVQNATTVNPEYQGNQLLGSESFPVAGPLTGNTNYYWRIDEVDALDNVTKGAIWQFKTGTGEASFPTPTNLAQSVDINTNLSWTAGSGATSHDVYLGTDQTAVTNATTATPTIYKGNQTGTTFDPPLPLDGGTTYYWRIDEIGAGGTATGTVWAFSTRAGLAAAPIAPANGATGVALSPTLTWNAGAGAASHDIYFGTSQTAVQNATPASAEYQANQPVGSESYAVAGPLNGNTNYYWRIDELDALDNATKGTVWQFRTGTGPATAPSPEEDAQGVDINANLSWTAGSGATSHDVYLGTDQTAVTNATPATPGIYKGNQTGITYDPPAALNAGTTYYWRIDEIGPGGTTKGSVWTFDTGAGQATNPSPPDGAAGASLSPLLTWTPDPLATSQDVYFGNVFTAVRDAVRTSAEFQGNQVAATYTVGPLNGMTFYYWRIDSVTADGTTKGQIWQFRTGPAKANTPIPSDWQDEVLPTTLLRWTAGIGALTHDVYFSTSLADVVNGAPAAFQGNQSGTVFDPVGALNAGTEYFWRIDEVAADGTTKTPGDVWRFLTVAPGKATSPMPSDLATGVGLGTLLSWTTGAWAATHDVYFSTSLTDVIGGAPAAFRGNQATTVFSPAPLAAGVTYYWRIDEVSGNGTTKRTGDVWRFTTAP